MVPVVDRVSPLKILLADNHLVSQKTVLLMLKHLGYQADVARNGLEALNALQSQPYDVVLLDVQRPEMNGLAVAHWLYQQEPSHLRPYLIAMTSDAVSGDRDRYRRAGVNDYINKPIQMQVLGQVLGRYQPLAQSSAPIEGRVASSTTVSPISSVCLNHTALDLAVLSSFREEMGDGGDAVVAEIITCYLAEAPQLLQTLHVAIGHHDVKTVQLVAHGLKASSASLGACSLSQRCKELETMALSASIDQVAGMIADLESEYVCVEAALRQTQSYQAS